MTQALDTFIRYAAASRLISSPGRSDLCLASDLQSAGPPLRFDGAFSHPALAARMLRSVGVVVRSRFHLPPNVVATLLDPVLTTGEGWLRVEGFSACAGVYARADLGPESHAGGVCSEGTTNVDFGSEMMAALAAVRDGDEFHLRVGADVVEVSGDTANAIERKVPVPLRWLRSFVAVQDIQTSLPLRHEIAGVAAVRFLRALPRSPTKQPTWIVAAGRGLRASARPASGGVLVAAMQRLRVLEDLVHDADRMRVYGDEEGAASAWELDFGDRRFSLVLSPEAWRGFSGEGRALDALASPADESLVALLHRALRWRAALDASELARELGEPEDAVRRALVELGARGIVGFDLATRTWFHRELPFDLRALSVLQPRFAAAEKLAAQPGGVRTTRDVDGVRTFEAAGSGVTHTVVLGPDDDYRCTCTWHARHQGERGPCKHVMAARMVSERA